MKDSKDAGRKLAEFRRQIGKSQSQFAAMLGVSKHTIISVENDRNRLSPKLARRIRIATGAPVESESDLEYLDWWAKEKRFDTWRQHFKSDEETAQTRCDGLAYWIKLIFRAAGRPGIAGNRDRLPAVYLSLVEWLEETCTAFKLEREIDDILEQEPHWLSEQLWTDVQLRVDAESAKRVADQLEISVAKLWQGFKAHKKGEKWVLLHGEIEVRNVWDPHAGDFSPSYTKCKVKKLQRKPKYWFEPIDWPKTPKS
jgi:DNA-binding XRE family transcriptional regulator